MSVRPNFFILGAPKCGTTSLARYCAQNREIYVPSVKEVGFFNNPERFALGESYLRQHYVRGAQTKWRCDGTPTYLAGHGIVIPALQEFYKNTQDLRFVVIIRNPVDRFVSHYLHNLNRHSETRDINVVAAVELDLYRRKTAIEDLEYLGPGFYDKLIAKWQRDFDASQFLILSSESLNESRHSELAKLWTFLDVPEVEDIERIERNMSGMPRSHWVQKWVSDESAVGKGLIRHLMPERWRASLRLYVAELNTSRDVRRPVIRDEIIAQLTDIYGDSMAALSLRGGSDI